MRVTQRKKKYGAAGKRRRSDRNFGKRLFSLLLGLSWVLPLLCNFCGRVLSSAALPTSAKYIMNRIADSNTMDDYLKQLLSSEWGSRYAGRIWTDKSVFAFDPALGTDWNKIALDMATDGYYVCDRRLGVDG